ncbi:MAG: DUF6011 domain-containing protein [Mycobacterium sp.]
MTPDANGRPAYGTAAQQTHRANGSSSSPMVAADTQIAERIRSLAMQLDALLCSHPVRCVVCNRPLTAPTSVLRGIGPVCVQRRPCRYADTWGRCLTVCRLACLDAEGRGCRP